jgi:hypothetical protein
VIEVLGAPVFFRTSAAAASISFMVSTERLAAGGGPQ